MSPNDLCSKGTPSPVANNPVHIIDTEEKEAIDVDDDTLQGSRTDKRLNWSREEDTRLERVKEPLSDFHACWVKSARVWQSGMSDDQIKEKAKEMYANQNHDKPFTLEHIWKVVRGEKKWSAYVNRLNKEKETMQKLTQLKW
uniref:No apical meristem-associated C-terminal domain-containing protein n=1 Tax=Oryza brachyantha TaxID=4533 RepID=J3NDB2_ORYBR